MKRLKILCLALINCLILFQLSFGRSPSFKTYTNPVIPGDHPDCSLTKVGNDFYTSFSSYNPTPVIYHSTDLVHWEAIAQPVSAAWPEYGDAPGPGCVGGQMVYYNNKYWYFFSHRDKFYFTTADKPEGPWSLPTVMKCPPSVPGLGYDNSIFIDDDGKWYLLVKNGQVNNWIVELGEDGQPSGAVYDLRWINPAPDFPYSWAEGPVMWKYNGYYYYSFALNVAGGQKVMRSKTLTDDRDSWEMLGDLFNVNDPDKATSLFFEPNHCSQVVMLNDSTFWLLHPVYPKASEWRGQGRATLLNQVHYDSNGKPIADYPVNKPFTAPNLPSSGIPWMVPKSDFFTSDKLNPEWSFLGYTPENTYSLTDRPGWLRLSPKSRTKWNMVIKGDREHNYSLITRVDFCPSSANDEAGLIIIRGDEKKYVKLFSSINENGHKVVVFSYDNIRYEVENTVENIVWLKMVRSNHKIIGYYSSNGRDWKQVGKSVDIIAIDSYTDPNFWVWEGTRQGLYVQGRAAYFDLYIYRDAYTPIMASCPANQYGTSANTKSDKIYPLESIHNDDWTLYAGVEFRNKEYGILPKSIQIIASSATDGGIVEVWLDSIDTGNKIGICKIRNTGSWENYKTFSAKVKKVTGRHDVYLRFKGKGNERLFRIKWLKFIPGKVR